jgi:hypothetical protein
LADQYLDDAIIHGVIRRLPDVEFHRLRDFGMEESSDDDVLAFANDENYIVVSHDVNSMTAEASRRMTAGLRMCGLLLIQQQFVFRPIIESLVLIASDTEAEEWENVVDFLPY